MHLHGHTVKVVSREIRPQVCAVAVDGTVLHEAIGKERFLTRANVLASEDCLPRLGDDAGRNRRAFLVNANRQISEDSETKKKGEGNTLEPSRGELPRRGCESLHG